MTVTPDIETTENAYLRDLHLRRYLKEYVDSVVGTPFEMEDTGWVDLAYQNSYAANNGAGSTPGQLQYRQYGQLVRLRGGAYKSTIGSSSFTTCATLPVGFRPQNGPGATENTIVRLPAEANDGATVTGWVEVRGDDGTIRVKAPTGSLWIALDIVSFLLPEA